MRLTHGRVTLELHELARRDGPSLLLLHSLYGASADWGEAPATWHGSVFALDFAGHGQSDWVVGGGYHPELLVGDADAALAHIGSAAVAGAGLGAYIALLLAGARRDAVPAALLLPGAGLSGGGALPDFEREFPEFEAAPPGERGTCDPLVCTLESDVRPADYAESFAHAARHLLLAEDGTPRPLWWEAARRGSAESVSSDLQAALARLRAVASTDH